MEYALNIRFVNIKSYYELSQHNPLLFFITTGNPKTYMLLTFILRKLRYLIYE